MIQLYCMDITALSDVDAALHSLSQYRKTKIALLKREEDRIRAIGASYLLSHALRQLGYEERHMEYAVTAHGKPYFRNCALYFSLSHSASYALCALSDSEVGADVQICTAFRLNVAQKYFTQEQYHALLQSDDPDPLFTLYWAQMEARGKYLGRGVIRNMPQDGKLWSVYENGYAFSVCGEEMFDGNRIILV